MNDADETRANETIECLIHVRDMVEDVYLAEILDGLIKALEIGGDHPLLRRWAAERIGI